MSFKTKRFVPFLSVLVLFFGMLALLSTNGLPTKSVAQAASHDVATQIKSDDAVTQAAPLQEGITSTDVIISNTSPAYGFDNVSTLIYINGSGFEAPVSVKLGLTQSLQIVYSDTELLAAIVPAGVELGLYNVTVEAAGGSATDPNGYEVLHADDVDDLLSSEDWLWTDPFPLRVGYRGSRVGLLVQHLGGRRSIDEVYVEFWLDHPLTGTLLGGGWTNVLRPFDLESTSPVVWEPEETGVYTVCAVIDPVDPVDLTIIPDNPNGQVEESDEENNTVCRELTVLPSNLDVFPPEVEQGGFVISDSALSTSQVTVTLDVISATDLPNIGASGLQALKFVEFEYILGAHRWVPVQRTGWMTYTDVYQGYPWRLIPTFGMRYMQAWVADNAGNISLEAGADVIDLLPSDQPGFVAKHDVVFYRILLEEGESFTARLTPVDGDPDLYLWSPNGALSYAPSPIGIEEVSVKAPSRGTYQIEIHGFTNAEYRLEFNPTTRRATPTFMDDPSYRTNGDDRIRPSEPAVALDDWPEFFDVEAAPIVPPTNNLLYLPITIGQ